MVAIAATRTDKSEWSDQREAPIGRLLLLPSCLGRDPAPLLEDELSAHWFTVAWNRESRRRHQPNHRIQCGWPLFWNRVGAKRRWPGRFQQVPGKQHVGIGYDDHEVSIGMSPAEVSDLHPPITQVECRRDRYLHVRLSQLVMVQAQPSGVRCGSGGRKSEPHRFMGDPWNVGESCQSERMVIMPMCNHDGRQWEVRHSGERRAKRTALRWTPPSVDEQGVLRSNDESEVHRFRFCHSHVHA